MSRVEPTEGQQQQQPQQQAAGRIGERREFPHTDRTPGKAEGDEDTIEEALRNQERSQPE